MIRFIVALLINAGVLAGVTIYAVDKQWISELPTFFYQTLIFLVFSTTVIYAYLHKIDKPDFFVQLYLLTMAVKFLAYGVYVYFIISEDGVGAVNNTVFFMITYFSFTFLEITFLYHKISVNHVD